MRDLFEESGIAAVDIRFGRLPWFGEFDLLLDGVATRIEEQFIVARTRRTAVSLHDFTKEETSLVKRVQWFSLDRVLRGD